MDRTRRDLIRNSALAATLFAFGRNLALAEDAPHGAPKDAPKPAGKGGRTLLVMGGTAFLGPEIVHAAQARGWTITLFNRGKTNPGLFKDLEQIHGDRNVEADLDKLKDRRWDAVVDTSAYFPKQVDALAARLAPNIGQYVFISTISVFGDTSKPLDESGAVGKVDPQVAANVTSMKQVTGELYGPLKALCEEAAMKDFAGKATVIRPGLIVGPGDPSDRFTYWPVRFDRGGEVLAPGTPDDPVQVIDVRDLGDFGVRTIADGTLGLFNATGPASTLGVGRMLEACRKAAGKDVTVTWVPAEFLGEQKVSPWSDMPVWLPPVGETAGFAKIDCRKAIAKGLTFRSIDETAADTLKWWRTLPEERRAKTRAGLAPEREKEVLAAWHAAQTAGPAHAAPAAPPPQPAK